MTDPVSTTQVSQVPGWYAVGPKIIVTGIPSVEAFGLAAVRYAQTMAPAGITSAEVFGTITVTRGAVQLVPAGIPSAEAFGTPTVARPERIILDAGIVSAEAFGTPTVGRGAVQILPSGIVSAEAFGTPTVVALPPPAYDNSGGSGYQNGVGSGSPFTWTQTVTAGAYVVVAVFGGGNSTLANPTSSVVTVGGTTLSPLGPIVGNNNNASASGWVRLFGGISPTGGTLTISVTLTQAGQTFYGWGASSSYTGVVSAGSTQSAFGSSISPAGSVSSAARHIAFGAFCAFSYPTFSAFSKTLRQTKFGSGVSPSAVTGDGAGAPSVAFGATLSGSQPWAFAGVDLS